MSRAQKPSAIASSARFCAADAELVLASRVTPASSRDVLGGLTHGDVGVGIRPSSRGSVPGAPALGARSAVRAAASANSGLRVSGSAVELPVTGSATTHSTPAEMKTSPSPALMAWKAMRVVCRDEEQ